MAKQYRDDLDRALVFPHPPQRIVSLVPSDTYSVFALGAGGRVVGRTSYCEEPKIGVPDVSVVGGTKDVCPDKVAALAPDLVLANKEENTQEVLSALAERGLTVWVSFPRRVADGIAHLARLARVLGIEKEPKVVDLMRRGYECVRPANIPEKVVKVFAPVWDQPLMTMNADTYGSDVIGLLGGENVFAGRQRNYPLAADHGRRDPMSDEEVGDRDRRYPRITEEELVNAAPEVVLLPDEPHAYSGADVARFLALDIPAAASKRVYVVSGKDLFWYGAWAIDALPRLRSAVSQTP